MMALSTTDRILAAREAGNVRRCHVVPHHGDYTNGKHSHDALSLLFILHPDPSINLIKAVHWHDGAERWVGDMPAPSKIFNPALRDEYERSERIALRRWEMHEGVESLTVEEAHWLRAIDALELMLWCMDQEALGNRHVYTFADTLKVYFGRLSGTIPAPVQEVIDTFEWRRLEELRREDYHD